MDLLFPPVCAGCETLGHHWCENCQREVVPLVSPYCEVCGLPYQGSGICPDCAGSRPPFIQLRSWLAFEGPIRNALHRLKYRRDLGLGEVLSTHLASYVSVLDWQVDLVVPIPLGQKRMQERGYNQVSVLAWPLAARVGWKFESNALMRVRETVSQVGLSAQARKKNVQDAFYADVRKVHGRSVVIMDDVATTGATLSASALALLRAGADRVYALTVARALPHHGLKIV